MTDTSAPAGLIGAFHRAAASQTSQRLADPLRWIVRLVLIAGFVLVLKKAKGNADMTDAAVIMLLGCAALMSEYYMGGQLVRGWFERSIPKMASSALVYTAVLGYAALQWTGTAAEMEAQKTGAQKAAYVAQEDTSKTEAELTVKNNDLLQRIALAPKRGPEAAHAAMERAKGDALWKRTEGCTDVSTKKSREFCDAYTSAVADLEGGKNLVTWRAEQEQVADDLKKIREGRKSTVVVSEDRSDLRFLTQYAGLSQQAASDFSAAWKIVIISILSFILGMMIEAREHAGETRKPWGFSKALYAVRNWVWEVLTGKPLTKVHHTTIIRDARTVAEQGA